MEKEFGELLVNSEMVAHELVRSSFWVRLGSFGFVKEVLLGSLGSMEFMTPFEPI